MDDGSKKKIEADVEKVDEENETKSKKKKIKKDSYG
jgi:hypothetical protein